MDYGGYGVQGQIGRDEFNNINELRAITGGKHDVQVNISVFKSDVEFPNPAIPEREFADLRLKSGSAAVDAGQSLPNVNDGFGGKATDLGAYELGSPMPHYGPRPRRIDEETAWN